MRWRAVQLASVQAVYFIRLLILARLLAPDAFGLLAIAMVALGVMLQLSDVGMLPALVHRRDATVEEHDVAWTIGLLRAVLVAILLIASAPWVATAFGEPRAAPIIQALALRPVLEAAASIGIARLTRELRFRELALMYMPGAVIDMVTAVATAPWLGVWALVAGAMAGAASTAVLSYILAPHRPRIVLRAAQVGPLVQFGRWVMFTGIVGLVGSTTIQLLISRTLGASALGLYFLASKVAFLPLDAASRVVGSVALPLFARLREDARQTAAAFSTLFTGQAILLLPIYGILLVLAPSLEAALGPRWSGTAPVMQILAVSAVTGLLGELLGPLFMGRGRPDRTFFLEVVQTGLLMVALWPLIGWLGTSGAALAWLLGNVAAMIVGLSWLRRMLSGEATANRAGLAAAGAAALAGSTAAAAANWLLTDLSALIVGGTVGAAVAGTVLLILDRRLGLHLGELIAQLRGSQGRTALPEGGREAMPADERGHS